MSATAMQPDRWHEIDAILGAALERNESERSAFLAEACGGDAELRREVESLLAAAHATSDLEQPPADLAASFVAGQRRASMQGRSIGRYMVFSELGEGGMGVVYAAYDPELDRKVAVKVLRERLGDAAELRARLLREAQAMARLSHPNVVSVHDVGRFEDKVFVAMEFIDGRTLGDWLKEKPRSWREVLTVFREAGKGLAAAHSAGLVHRDFKPGNVLVGKDDAVKVTDFGLAFTPAEAGAAGGAAIAGTPAYMAPEQLRGEKLDARADQYSFCVALYEALASEQPTEGTTCATLASHLEAGSRGSKTWRRAPGHRDREMIELRAGRGVPRWLLRPILRGLSPERSNRFASLDELLKSLNEPVSSWKRVSAGLAVVAVLVSCFIGYRLTVRQQSLLCRGAELRLAGIWDPAREEAIHRAFLSTGKPFAADAFKGVKRALDAQSQAWVAMHTDACQATRLRGEQSETLLDLRMGCLRGRLEEIRALTNVFARADAQAVEKAVEAAQTLTPLRGCADVALLTAQVKPPEDAEAYAQVERHRSTLAEIKALKETGAYSRGPEMAKQLAAASRETRYKPLEAEAQLLLGDLLARMNQTKEAEEAYGLAAINADAVRDDVIRAKAWTQLAYVRGYQATRMEEGLRLGQQAAAVVERLGNPPELESGLLYSLGSILLRQARHVEALQRLKQALEIRQNTLGPEHPDVASTLNVLGIVSREAGRYDEALAYSQKALQISETSFGPEHPLVAEGFTNLGNVLREQGKFDAALEAQRRALAIREKVFGPAHPRVASSLMNVGTILRFQGRFAEALPLHQRALEIEEKVLGPEHPDLVSSLGSLGTVTKDLGDLEASLAYHRRAVVISEKAFGPEHPKVAKVLNNLASALYERGDIRSSLQCLRRALAIREKALGAEHAEVATTLQNLGYGLYELNKRGNFQEALGYLRRALAIREKSLGPESAGAADVLAKLGALESEQRLPEGLAHLQRALNIREKTLPAESPLIGLALATLGEAYLDLRQPFEARPRLERALTLLESSKGNRSKLAWTRFQLARALWDSRSDPKRAVALAQQSLAALLESGKGKRNMVRKVEAWLSRRPRLPDDASAGAGQPEGL